VVDRRGGLGSEILPHYLTAVYTLNLRLRLVEGREGRACLSVHVGCGGRATRNSQEPTPDCRTVFLLTRKMVDGPTSRLALAGERGGLLPQAKRCEKRGLVVTFRIAI
jgi:hypothetical protein